MLTLQRLPMFALAVLLAAAASAQTAIADPPAVGDQAPTATLKSTTGDEVDLANAFSDGKTVLVFLRGYPGYQCGICAKQTAGYFRARKKFAEAGVRVILVYPGADADLSARADEFVVKVTEPLKAKKLPKKITMLLDPGFELTNAYGLRWDAPNETAYPATFVIDEGGEVRFAKISDGHGGRVAAKAALAAATE